jgi:hypothetical protein
MNQEPKTAKKPNTKSKAQIRDLKPKKDPKGSDGPSENCTLTYGRTHPQY